MKNIFSQIAAVHAEVSNECHQVYSKLSGAHEITREAYYVQAQVHGLLAQKFEALAPEPLELSPCCNSELKMDETGRTFCVSCGLGGWI